MADIVRCEKIVGDQGDENIGLLNFLLYDGIPIETRFDTPVMGKLEPKLIGNGRQMHKQPFKAAVIVVRIGNETLPRSRHGFCMAKASAKCKSVAWVSLRDWARIKWVTEHVERLLFDRYPSKTQRRSAGFGGITSEAVLHACEPREYLPSLAAKSGFGRPGCRCAPSGLLGTAAAFWPLYEGIKVPAKGVGDGSVADFVKTN